MRPILGDQWGAAVAQHIEGNREPWERFAAIGERMGAQMAVKVVSRAGDLPPQGWRDQQLTLWWREMMTGVTVGNVAGWCLDRGVILILCLSDFAPSDGLDYNSRRYGMSPQDARDEWAVRLEALRHLRDAGLLVAMDENEPFSGSRPYSLESYHSRLDATVPYLRDEGVRVLSEIRHSGVDFNGLHWNVPPLSDPEARAEIRRVKARGEHPDELWTKAYWDGYAAAIHEAILQDLLCCCFVYSPSGREDWSRQSYESFLYTGSGQLTNHGRALEAHAAASHPDPAPEPEPHPEEPDDGEGDLSALEMVQSAWLLVKAARQSLPEEEQRARRHLKLARERLADARGALKGPVR